MSENGAHNTWVNSRWEFMTVACFLSFYQISDERTLSSPFSLWLHARSSDASPVSVCHFMAATCHFSTSKITKASAVTVEKIAEKRVKTREREIWVVGYQRIKCGNPNVEKNVLASCFEDDVESNQMAPGPWRSKVKSGSDRGGKVHRNSQHSRCFMWLMTHSPAHATKTMNEQQCLRRSPPRLYSYLRNFGRARVKSHGDCVWCSVPSRLDNV